MSKNRYKVAVVTELGCSFDEGECSIYITEILEGYVGRHDFDLVFECIYNNVEANQLPEEGVTMFILKETGEWEDVHWHKYYEIEERLPNEE